MVEMLKGGGVGVGVKEGGYCKKEKKGMPATKATSYPSCHLNDQSELGARFSA